MPTQTLQQSQTLSPLGEYRVWYQMASRAYQVHKESSSLDEPSDALSEAYEHAQIAHDLHPQHLPTLNLLSRIALERKHYTAAMQWVQQGLAIKPKSASLLYSAGHIAMAQHRWALAESYFERSLNISRVATRAASSLAHLKLLSARPVEAFKDYRELIKTHANDIVIKNQLFEACSHIKADFYNDELEQDLLRYLTFTDVDHSQLRQVATSLLMHKFQLTLKRANDDESALKQLLSDPLLQACLKAFVITHTGIESLILNIRQHLLFHSARTLTLANEDLPCIIAIAQQSVLNEGTLYISKQEQAVLNQLNQLGQRICDMQDPLEADAIYPVLLLTLMYQPGNIPYLEKLAQKTIHWPDSMRSLMQDVLYDAQQDRDYKHTLVSIGNLSDHISKHVADQYEQHPYPRWNSIGYNTPSDYWSTLNDMFPSLQHTKPITTRVTRALVAGCGTGRHAIRLAKYFHNMDVTALDLSRTSLAYAARKAQHYDVDNIRFIHGDLLQASHLDAHFDLIECSGVLHHMRHPEEGLAALAKQLAPNGVIKIALYSATARKKITAIRDIFAKQMPSSDEDIRLVRQAIMQGNIEGDWSEIMRSPDFYTLSSCRDLLFHTQEHVFDVSTLPKWLEQAGLQWVGMIPPPNNHKGLHPQAHVDEWAAYEQENPQLFAGMYQFYAQKPKRQ